MRTIVLLFFLALLAACSPAAQEVIVTQLVDVPVEVTRLVEVVETVEVPVEVTREVEVVVTEIVEVTPEPPPLPEVFYEVEFTQGVVTDNFTWGACQKAVFVWELGPGYAGAILHRTSDGERALIVNETGPDASGETLQPLAGGEYYFEIELSRSNSFLKLRGECRD